MNYKLLQSLIVLMLVCSIAYGQKASYLKGYVSDADGPIVGATIWIEGTQEGTTTNVNGYYELYFDAKANISLSFSCIGKKTETRIYDGQSELNVELKDDLLTLSEVQITAKPNINEVDVRAKTGNVAVVAVEDLQNTPVSSMTLALQGKVAGLHILNRGELGTLPQIRIRGNSSFRKGDLANQPLYILDGKMIPTETFFYLNPEDIKEMKVLKDAVASALYGIKAANGVIEITSKRGGEKRLNFHTQVGVTLKTPLRVEMMNSAEKLELERLLRNEATPGYLFSTDYITKKYGGTAQYQKKLAEGNRILDSLRTINTDWYKEFSRIQSYQKYDVSYTEGNDKTTYFLSLGYMNQGGQLEGNSISRLSARLALDKILSEKAIVALSLTGGYGQSKTPRGNEFSLDQLVYQLNPYETKSSKKLWSYPIRSYAELFNQFSRESTNKNIGSSLSLNWKLSENFDISAVAGFDYSLGENLEIIPETAISEIRKRVPNARGTLRQSKNTTTNVTANVRANYSRKFGSHEITFGVNADNYTTIRDNLNVEGHGLYGSMHSASSIDNSLTGAGRSLIGALKQTERNIGFGGLIGYTFSKKYNLFATYKLDASSVLPKSHRWNSAWALGLSLDLKKFSIFEKLSWLSALNLRGSWGNTANAQGISPALTRSTFRYQSFSYGGIRTMDVLALPNKDLKAEQNEILDLGFSAVFPKMNFHISAYKRTTKDALLNVPIASSSGFAFQFQNIGILENKGVEVGIEQQIYSSENWNIRMGTNISFNKNKVLDLYGKDRLYLSETSILPEYEVGKSTDALYGFISTGINPVTGLPEYINHIGEQVDAYTQMKREDYVELGKTTPPVNGSLFLNLGYQKLQIGMSFYYNLGGKQAYSNSYIRNKDGAVFNAAKAQLDDMWWKVGDDNKKYPTAFYSSTVSYNLEQATNRTVVKTDFIRFSNLSIKYRLDSDYLQHFSKKLRYVTLGINASNLFTFSRFEESDPETSNIISPLPPTITFNLNVTF